MAATVHIPISDMERALQHARVGKSVVLEGDGEAFHLERIRAENTPFLKDTFRTVQTDFRPLSVILADPEQKWSDVRLDDQWERDMTRIRAENRADDPDPWAE